ncbi:hypothetical protein H7T85_17400 [Bacillus velezensis]|nr:hypothetical protein [Bacillus velezensis]MBY0044478.1 hypothetical protein [Bacillus velezensis]
MAADILLFQSDFVPVGKDQIQHGEPNILVNFNSLLIVLKRVLCNHGLNFMCLF